MVVSLRREKSPYDTFSNYFFRVRQMLLPVSFNLVNQEHCLFVSILRVRLDFSHRSKMFDFAIECTALLFLDEFL